VSDPASPGAGILCAGTNLADVGKVIDTYPDLDHFATIEHVSLSTRGSGVNMAVEASETFAEAGEAGYRPAPPFAI
jgi:hypothetical protein